MDKTTDPSTLELDKQAEAIRRNADLAAMRDQPVLLEGANQLSKLAAWRRRKQAASNQQTVQDLPTTASQQDIRKARSKSSIRWRDQVFLPICASQSYILPHVFLRSALFSAGNPNQNDGVQEEAGGFMREIHSQSDFKLTYSGSPLARFDRRVYATCLKLFNDRPLSAEVRSDEVDGPVLSVYSFFKAMGTDYNRDQHIKLRNSLDRLSHASVQMICNGVNTSISQLLDVEYQGVPDELKAKDRLYLRIPESVANLFGQGKWATLPEDIFQFKGLLSWLACYLATHTGAPVWVTINRLHKMSGLAHQPPHDFERSLMRALANLTPQSVPERCRVKEWPLQKGKDGIKVMIVKGTRLNPPDPVLKTRGSRRKQQEAAEAARQEARINRSLARFESHAATLIRPAPLESA